MNVRMVSLSLCMLFASLVYAELRPVWKPDDLVPRSSLVVLATQKDAHTLSIQMVFKGAWPEREIAVIDLPGFRQAFGRFAGLPDPELKDELVAFISWRRGKPGVVANGVFRVTSDGKVLGYAQDINPGPYELQPTPVYPSLDELIDKVEAAKSILPKRQDELMKELSNAETDRDFRWKLYELEQLTCVGDTKVFEFVAERLGKGAPGRRCLYFLQNIPDPAIFPLLKAHYQKTRDVNVLTVIGRQGSPDALSFLKSIIVKNGNNERGRFASYAIMSLYVSLEEHGMTEECEKVREVVFGLFDKEESFREYAAGSPQVLGVIPHSGSISRLEEALKRVKGDQSNREYEVESVLKNCRQKIEQHKKASTR